MVKIGVTLGAFARAAVEGYFGADLAPGVRAALRHYVRRLAAGCRLVRPRTPLAPSWGRGSTEVEITLAVDEEAALAEHAQRHGIGLRDLAAHAVYVYLAELELLEVPPRPQCPTHRSH